MPRVANTWKTPEPNEAIDSVLDLKGLTWEESILLRYIARHISEYHSFPTASELALYIGVKNGSTPFYHLRDLVRRGRLERLPHSKAYRLVGVKVILAKEHQGESGTNFHSTFQGVPQGGDLQGKEAVHPQD